jgi:hypothetical protein
MALIQGRNGRMYDSATGKRVDTVAHPETRSRSEIMKARAATMPTQPSGEFTGNPFDKTIELELKRHHHLWAQSDEGKRVLGNLRRSSKEWEADRKAKADAAEFAASIADLVGHATAQYELVIADETATVEECELAATALEAAKRGERDTYIAWERERHAQVTAKLAETAADFDSQARAAVEKRNAVLASALEPPPVPEVKKPEPEPMNIPIDRSRVSITRKIPVAGGGVRQVTEIVDREDIE